MAKALTLGSLFDGSGTFPLAAIRAGITPVWASEIEPVPIRVTRKNIPGMTHLGDMNEIDGAQITPVDIVAFGSPCTDLSVAGKRTGLNGKASGLFFEATRIVKQMREATSGQFPRFVVWENVPGAFSSQKGEDFATVINTLLTLTQTGGKETAGALPEVTVPKKGWAKADLIVGNGFSLAWRVLDAQYWGVAQRRKRIFLILDLAGQPAPEILFDPKSSQQDFEPGSQAFQTPPTSFASSLGNNSFRPGINMEAIPDANAKAFSRRQCYGFNALHSGRGKSAGKYGYLTEVAKTLDLRGGKATCNQGGMIVTQPHNTQYENDGLVARHLTPLECSRLQGFPDNWTTGLEDVDPSGEELSFWMKVFATYARVTGRKPRTEKQVRTWLSHPVPDGALYRMWGNGIALPCAQFIMNQIANHAQNRLQNSVQAVK